jgi:HK97 gp10 family phage protein
MSITIVGIPHFRSKMSELNEAVQLARKVAAMAGGKVIENAWKQRIRKDAFKTGTYLRSVTTEITEESTHQTHAIVGTDLVDPPYPFFLEYGTVRMAPRPTMTPAFAESKDKAVAEVHAVFRTALYKVAP